MTIHDFFDGIYIINLPERVDRRAETILELSRAGINPDSPRVQFFPAIRPPDAGTFLNRATRGCFLSHLGVLQEAKRLNFRNVLILEDDVSLSPRLPLDEERLIGSLQVMTWGIVYFGNLRHPLDGQVPVQLEPFSSPQIGCHFYGVSGSVFDPLIHYLTLVEQRPPGHPEGGGVPLDGAINMFRERFQVPSLIALPNLGGQRSTRSDITPRWFDRVPLLRNLIETARRFKRGRGST